MQLGKKRNRRSLIFSKKELSETESPISKPAAGEILKEFIVPEIKEHVYKHQLISSRHFRAQLKDIEARLDVLEAVDPLHKVTPHVHRIVQGEWGSTGEVREETPHIHNPDGVGPGK